MSSSPIFIRDKAEIERLKRRGRKLSGRHFYLRFAHNDKGPRFVVVVSTKYDKRAVRRNRIRRQVKEILRLGFKAQAYPQKIAAVIIPLKSDKEISFADLEKDLLILLKKIR